MLRQPVLRNAASRPARAGGMRFTDAYAACPVCSPTRASILTGKYPATVGITNYIPRSGEGQAAFDAVSAPPAPGGKDRRPRPEGRRLPNVPCRQVAPGRSALRPREPRLRCQHRRVLLGAPQKRLLQPLRHAQPRKRPGRRVPHRPPHRRGDQVDPGQRRSAFLLEPPLLCRAHADPGERGGRREVPAESRSPGSGRAEGLRGG